MYLFKKDYQNHKFRYDVSEKTLPIFQHFFSEQNYKNKMPCILIKYCKFARFIIKFIIKMKRSILVLLPIIFIAGMLAISGCKKKATYTVTFDPNGGSGTMQPQLFTEGEKQPLAYNAFYYDGFSFSGWSDSRFGSSQFTDGQTISVESDMTLYAQWTANQGTQSGTGQGGGGSTTPTFEYVDLGLPSGTLWATCNIGASKAEDYGSYFAWGETTAKASYDLDSYTLYNGSYTKYNGYDYITTLEETDDAATSIWGSGWRMPTRAEMNELFNNCSYTWSTVNNIGGYRFTANNGKSIFLPAAGYRIGGDLNDASLFGYYWTSSLYTDYYYENAYCRSFQQNNNNSSTTYKNRFYGMTIRPVHSRIEKPTVQTNSATNITANAATFEGYVANNGGANITACGFQYGTNYSNLTMEISSTLYGNNSFTSTISNFEPNTTYYYRAYATNSAGTGYGDVRSFTTSSGSGSISNPTVYTYEASSVTSSSAIIYGYISNNGGAEITSRGFMWGTSSSNLYNNAPSYSSYSEFYASLSSLSPNTTYYYKAYATNSAGTGYGEVRSFTTTSSSSSSYSDPTGYANDYGYVDLGLPSGTKWATCNIGASSPTSYGYYFAWGETYNKSDYNSSNYTYSDNPATLPASADAAYYYWGYYWRMPTYNEATELVTNCTTTWTSINGVYGKLFTGPNGNSIFIPAAGHYSDEGFSESGEYGDYWSSSIDSENYSKAYLLEFSSENTTVTTYCGRSCGFPVRPVLSQYYK